MAQHGWSRILVLLACLGLPGCGSLLTESASTGSAVAGAAAAGAITHNAAVATGIGLGVQAAAQAGLAYAERVVHGTEQDAIAVAAGALKTGDVGTWKVAHDVPIEPDERGELAISREFGTDEFRCREIVFSVDTDTPRGFYVADICRDGEVWRWASAEPATPRWGALQ